MLATLKDRKVADHTAIMARNASLSHSTKNTRVKLAPKPPSEYETDRPSLGKLMAIGFRPPVVTSPLRNSTYKLPSVWMAVGGKDSVRY